MDIQKYFIDENSSVIEAMKQLDKEACKVLFIQENGVLKAALSDGDVRRWIVDGGSLEEQIKKIANYSPKYVYLDNKEKARDILESNSVEVIPIVDDKLVIVDIVTWNSKEKRNHKEAIDVPVVMMAGGKGTRLYPYTKILPKPLIPIGEIPIAEHIIQSFVEVGCNKFYLIVNHKKGMIKAYFNDEDNPYKIEFVDENEPLGTGGGLSLLDGLVDETFILTNCDILLDVDFSEIYKYHKEHRNIITMICALQNVQIPYGVVHMSEGGKIDSIQEKPELSFFTNTGCYIVEPEVIKKIEKNTFIGFPDIIEEYRKEGRNVGVFPIGEKAWMDMGQIDELEKMRSSLAKKD